MDRLFVVSGLVTIVVFDGRDDSPTHGLVNAFTVSDKNPGLLLIPPNLYHGWKNIGTSEAIIINLPDRMYNHEQPDASDLPWDSEAARRIVPHRWKRTIYGSLTTRMLPSAMPLARPRVGGRPTQSVCFRGLDRPHWVEAVWKRGRCLNGEIA